MGEFKVGDKVKIKQGETYGCAHWSSEMNFFVNKIGTIIKTDMLLDNKIAHYTKEFIDKNRNPYYFIEDWLEPVDEKNPHMTVTHIPPNSKLSYKLTYAPEQYIGNKKEEEMKTINDVLKVGSEELVSESKHGVVSGVSANLVSSVVVSNLKKALGEHYPKFFETAAGKVVEPLLVSGAIFFLVKVVDNYIQGKVPMLDKVGRASSMAFGWFAGQLVNNYMSIIIPFLTAVGKEVESVGE